MRTIKYESHPEGEEIKIVVTNSNTKLYSNKEFVHKYLHGDFPTNIRGELCDYVIEHVEELKNKQVSLDEAQESLEGIFNEASSIFETKGEKQLRDLGLM